MFSSNLYYDATHFPASSNQDGEVSKPLPSVSSSLPLQHKSLPLQDKYLHGKHKRSKHRAADDGLASPEVIAKNFSHHAKHYDAVANIQHQIAQDTLQQLALNANDTVLDIGCGTGRHTAYLSARSAVSVGVDIAPGMLRVAQQRDKKSHFVLADAQRLPFNANTFSKVFSSMALQWCDNPKQVIKELYRVTQPNGQLVLSIMVDGSFSQLRQACRRAGLAMHVNQQASAEDWQMALDNVADEITSVSASFFTVVRTQVIRYDDYFDDIWSLLRSIKQVGAGGINGKSTPKQANSSFSRSDIQRLAACYPKDSEGGMPLSYQVLRLELNK